MALFHLHVTQVKRSAGQSVVTSAAYRAGEKLYSEYYGEVSDYTHKGGVVCTDILLPPQAPNQYQDRATLWNAVEKAERGKKAQLAYSFDIALQNEFSLEENIALARQFVSEQLVGRGMIADFAIHQPDKEDGGIPNPHFHVLCPIRPIEPDGKWGCKQRRRYRLDEDGNRIIMVDRKLLKNPNGLILGTPGSGKSFSSKREITNVFLVTEDDVLVCDPEDEYAPLVKRLGGQVVKISPTSTQYVNPMDINLNYSDDDNPLALKVDFLLSFCDIVVGSKDGLQPVEKTVIDRCVRNVYRPYDDVAAYMNFGTERASAYRILEDTLNLRDVRIYDTIRDGDTECRVLNQKETTLAQQKQQALKDAFKDWIWKDPQRRQELVRSYNERFNAIRPREYDGKHIVFTGMNPEITLREHQRNAIAHILYGKNTLLAHEVGAGKTFEMVAAAMESKRLGLCRKSLFAVPNHLVEQWASEFLCLYPAANILVTTKKDFEARNRKRFCAKIATGDYDAVIMGHSQFERLPVSMERRERLIQEQIAEIEDGIAELEASGAERYTIKQLERMKKSLTVRLEKLHTTARKDSVVTFEQLGVDRLFVDEAHSYKNLFLYTKMRNVAGLSTSDAQKSSDMLLKCRYINEITGGKGVVFATGTPVSNSMTELYTMQRYLQVDLLEKTHLSHFDNWASIFGETVTAIELAPEGYTLVGR